eukprot:6818924-Prymnesium_polylepis.1
MGAARWTGVHPARTARRAARARAHLVRASPAHVLRHGQARREHPIDAARITLDSSDGCERLHGSLVGRTLVVAHATEADMVR